MKLSPRRPAFSFWLPLLLALLTGVQLLSHAQTTETKPADPAVVSTSDEHALHDEDAAVPAKATTAEVSAETTKSASDKTAVEPSAADKVIPTESAATSEPEKAKSGPTPKGKEPKRSYSGRFGVQRHHSGNARVTILSDSTLEAGGEADAVVSVFGSSTSAGTVMDAVVSVLGSSTSSGDVGQAVVSIFGNTRVTDGSVGGTAVAVFGNTYVNGYVRGQVVAVFGNVEFGPNAVVDGEVVCVGGEVVRDPKAILHGHIQNVSIGGHHFSFDWLTAWVAKCLLLGRPLAFGEHLMWAWWVALTYLGIYALIALIAPTAVTQCVETLEAHPDKSILTGILTFLLTPLAYVLLALAVVIVVGAALIPLFTLGLFLAGVFGKVVMLAWLGRRVAKLVVTDDKIAVAGTVLLGGVVVLLLYTVPILGFIVYKGLGILGLGVVIYTLLLASKRKRKVPVVAKTVPPEMASPGIPPVLEMPVITPVAAVPLPPVISAATLPRAGFWIRVAASLLDVIMVAILFGMMNGVFSWFFKVSASFPFWFAVYNVSMWATKGTTIGGIICGLKVVRLDDRPLEWGVAIVRGLAGFLSLAVAGLGFIWVAFDDEKQSWHDKIAGTTVVHVPKGTSLL